MRQRVRSRWWLAVVQTGLFGLSCLAWAQEQDTAAEHDPARTVIVAGDHLEQTVRCAGHAVVVMGSQSHLTVLGPCTEVRIVGNRNWITVGATDQIVTKGNQNTVEYTERRTRVSDRGKGNTVAEKWPQ